MDAGGNDLHTLATDVMGIVLTSETAHLNLNVSLTIGSLCDTHDGVRVTVSCNKIEVIKNK